MTRNEAIKRLRQLETMCTYQDAYGDYVDAEPFDEAVNMAIKALDKPLPKPHERLMHWDTARRIITSPRSKSQMLAVLDGVPPVEALERKHGEWILIEDVDENGNALYECPFCHKSDCHAVSQIVSYCWNCGAEMRERKEDESIH